MQRSILRKLILPLLALGLLVLGCTDYWYRNVREISFDPQAWRTASVGSSREDIRLRMYPDLEAHYLVIGIESSQIRNLLGNPDYQGDRSMAYNVAGTFFLKILSLSFDNDGRLTSYGLGEP
jgi:hypothetical protein